MEFLKIYYIKYNKMDINLYTDSKGALKWLQVYSPIYIVSPDFKVSVSGKTLVFPSSTAKLFWEGVPFLK